jgi:hypothetical protein
MELTSHQYFISTCLVTSPQGLLSTCLLREATLFEALVWSFKLEATVPLCIDDLVTDKPVRKIPELIGGAILETKSEYPTMVRSGSCHRD